MSFGTAQGGNQLGNLLIAQDTSVVTAPLRLIKTWFVRLVVLLDTPQHVYQGFQEITPVRVATQ